MYSDTRLLSIGAGADEVMLPSFVSCREHYQNDASKHEILVLSLVDLCLC